jgi:uncharacterized protein with NRDE domain
VCTLTFAWQVFPDAPILVAANRDERRDRPSEPPSRTGTDPAIVAPRDAEAGGTWIGYNDAGVFVGITNRWMAEPTPERSRGRLVSDALGESDATAAARLVERALDEHDYAGFNLVVADRTTAVFFAWDGRLRVRQLDPGVHVVVNSGAALGGGGVVVDDFSTTADSPERVELADQQAANARAIRTELTPEPGENADAWLARAASVLRDHAFGVCIHENGFGTRSSSLIQLDGDGGHYRFAAGPPCETAYQSVDADESQL